MSQMPQEGSAAPDFALLSDSGNVVRLSDFRGRKIILYFYPKDMTSGCTAEAVSFRGLYPEFQKRNVVVLGVSPDSPASHEKFRAKQDLPFPLLSDEDHAASEAYGVWAEKKMYGRMFWGVLRATFVIDEQGNIAKVFKKVKPRDHAAEVLASLEA